MRYRGIASDPGNSDMTFSKYVIKGKVVDENGNGVWGIALSVGSDTVMSGADGSFFIHVKNTKPVRFAVAANASLQNMRWSIASAPASAYGVPEDAPTDIRVVVQMASALRASK
jgi:hypothetical protein